MTDESNDRELLKQYLLGEAREEEQTQIEERLLDDPDFFTELVAMEDSLTDQYVRAALSARETRKFEEHFLAAPERREKLMFARTLARHIAEQETPARQTEQGLQKRWLASFLALIGSHRAQFGMAVTAAALIIVASATWFYFDRIRKRSLTDGPQQARVEPQGAETSLPELNGNKGSGLPDQQPGPRTNPERGGQGLTTPRSPDRPAVAASVVSVSLLPGLLRDTGEMTKVKVPAAAERVQFKLALDPGSDRAGARNYRVELQDTDGSPLWQRDKLRPSPANQGRAVIVSAPASLLADGDYKLVLSSEAEGGERQRAGAYYFSIQKAKGR